MGARTRILAVCPPGTMRGNRPESLRPIESGSIPPRAFLLDQEWEYLYLGFDGAVLDQRMFGVALEHGELNGSDVLVFSSPENRLLTGVFDRAEERFQAATVMMRRRLFYMLGNKLFSRKVFESASSEYTAPFLHDVFLAATRIETLSFPWVAGSGNALPDDAEFHRFIDTFIPTE